MHEVGAVVDSAKADVSESKDRDRIRKETEKRQNTENKGTEPDNSLVTSWADKVEQGAKLPDDKDPTEFKAFKKAWRGWYNQSVNDSVTPETRAKNAARYQVGKEHLQKLGYQVVEFEHTGSVNLKRVDPYFYDFAGKRLSKEDMKESIGITTGWTEIEMDV